MKNINKATLSIAIGTLVMGIFLGWLFFGRNPSSPETTETGMDTAVKNEIWTCSMHPQIRQPGPGKCPICGMDLILLNQDGDNENPLELKMSPTAMQLANVQTMVLAYEKPVKEIRLNGKIKVDERKVYSQTSHIPGRIEKLMVSFTGEAIRKGQVLAVIYSPDLVMAQEELLEAYKIKDSQPALFEAARTKLRNWKLSEAQIDQTLKLGKPIDQFEVLADVSGVVMDKKVNLGAYVQKGTPLFEVADLSTVWALFDVYERDLSWIKKGDHLSFSVQSLPGEVFTGKITFIDPVLNAQTRVASARIEVSNRSDKLKPDMFVTGLVKSPLNDKKASLIVPKTAVMWTGKRSVVYVKTLTASGVAFSLREVSLGTALGEGYIIEEGLEVGEEIAVSGTFSIDAAAQLAGKPSMMNAGKSDLKTETPVSGDQKLGSRNPEIPISVKKEAKDALKSLFADYFTLQATLAQDDYAGAKSSSASLLAKLSKIEMSLFGGEAHLVWMTASSAAENALKQMSVATNLEELRVPFKPLSEAYISLARSFGPFGSPVYVQHCPMADGNKGGDWLSQSKEIENPYFGKTMLKCGKVVETY